MTNSVSQAVLVGPMPVSEREISRFLESEQAIFIAVDGGIQHFRTRGKVAHCYLGDGDSSSFEDERWLKENGISTHSFPQAKDATDFELAFAHARSLGLSEYICLGFLGSERDHEWGVINFLASTIRGDEKVFIVGENQTGVMMAGKASHTFEGALKERFSLLPLSPKVSGVHVGGARWILHDEELFFGDTRTLRNEGIGESVLVEWNEGVLLIWMS